ncbi:predicted protein [Histoplasma mississippiense (nom. inval.)]|nr:predicted protein [Histoplasma mississippiense (nom. inval.)]EDN09766.1 predicted protein [Histoplasma mississippiense (nom. inval.)]
MPTTPAGQEPAPPLPPGHSSVPGHSSPSSPPSLSPQEHQQNTPIDAASENNAAAAAAPLSSAAETTATPTATASPYQLFDTYPFATDPEFKLGLGLILGKPAGTPATEDEVTGRSRPSAAGTGGGDADEYAELGGELLLKAKIYYFTKL